jgi:uncharacterized protein
MLAMVPFHLAFPVSDLAATRDFYVGVLGCREGRFCDQWIDFDFFGHQITAHLSPPTANAIVNPVDGHGVPVPHFGVVLKMNQWRELKTRFEALDLAFGLEPHVRWEGQPGEQATMFVHDPSGNALEFKAFGDEKEIFAR